MNWTQEEDRMADLGDKRLNARLFGIGAIGSEAATEYSCRLEELDGDVGRLPILR